MLLTMKRDTHTIRDAVESRIQKRSNSDWVGAATRQRK